MTFLDLIQDQGAPNAEHTPQIEVIKGRSGPNGMVYVTVGESGGHPDTAEHHIAWVELYGVTKKEAKVVRLCRFDRRRKSSRMHVRARLDSVECFSGFCALVYCNVHGVWSGLLDVSENVAVTN